MSRIAIEPKSLPKPPVPYSPGILADNVLYVAGILALAEDMKTTVGIGDIRVQTRQVIETIKIIVEEAGGTLADVTFNSIFIRNLEDYAGMNEVYGQYFSEKPPARYCIQVGLVPPDCLIEIASIAHIDRA
jgi:aminoacrylate peracid reductase